MLIDLKKYFSGENIAQQIDYTIDLSAVEIDGVKPFVSPCNRCLKETRKEISHSISHVLVNRLNDEEDFDDYIVVEGEKLDLDELIYSDIILLTPSKYVCSDDCKGLCPVCGKNLNEGDCACAKQQTDPRLEALRQLLD